MIFHQKSTFSQTNIIWIPKETVTKKLLTANGGIDRGQIIQTPKESFNFQDTRFLSQKRFVR